MQTSTKSSRGTQEQSEIAAQADAWFENYRFHYGLREVTLVRESGCLCHLADCELSVAQKSLIEILWSAEIPSAGSCRTFKIVSAGALVPTTA